MRSDKTRVSFTAGLCFFLSILFSATVVAQEAKKEGVQKKAPGKSAPADKPAKPAVAEAKKTPRPDQLRVIYILDQLAEQAKEFESEALRIRVRARVADAIWDFDPPRARLLFEDAFRAVDAMKSDKQQANARRPVASPQHQLRSELLRLISPRDPELADRLVKSVTVFSETRDSEIQFSGPQSDRATLYFQAAMSIVNVNLPRATQLIKAGIDNGLNGPQLITALEAVHKTTPGAADELFLYALKRLQTNPGQPTLFLAYIAPYVFPDFAGDLRSPGTPTGDAKLSLSGPLLNAFYSALFRAEVGIGGAASPIGAATDYWAVQTFLPYFEQYLPEKAEKLRVQMQQIAVKVPEEQMESMIDLARPTGVSDLISKGDKAIGPAKDNFFTQAAMLALQRGDYEGALSIVKKINNQDVVNALNSAIRLEASMASSQKEDFDTAYAYARDIPNGLQRALAFSDLAIVHAARKDKTRALEVLHESSVLLAKQAEGPEKARALLGLAGAFTSIDTMRGFEVMRSAIDALNKAELTLTPSGVLIVGGTTTTSQINGRLGLNVFNFNEAFRVLARTDFDRSLLLAQALERKEASVLAQLAVCRAGLTKPEEERKSQAEK